MKRWLLFEVRHRKEVRESLDGKPGAFLNGWCWIVRAGSAAAVAIAPRL
jgi:hypothetical protein